MTLKELNEGDRFRFHSDPEGWVRYLSQKGRTEGYCPFVGQNTMGHSKECGEEVYPLSKEVEPLVVQVEH